MPRTPLKAYRAKRNLRRSGEPGGARKMKPAAVARYVIQKHDATRLHYDFRLEMDGVLKSWAVPKGLPERPGEKTLAIEVEDHPLDYAGFEGVIPEGNYGAGTVMLWDRGAYTVEGGDAEAAYRRGSIHLALKGDKCAGEWLLIRMRSSGKKTNWLMIKSRDRLKRAAIKRQGRDRSVLSGRSLAGIAASPDAQWSSN